jgi:putative ABC transport system ATP-binding protein
VSRSIASASLEGCYCRRLGAELTAADLVLVRGGRRILDGASIHVRAGEAVAIQGPSGSGKSSFARTLATLTEPDAGSLRLDGQKVSEILSTEYRRRVAFLAQQPAMFPGTVLTNLEAGPALRGEPLGHAEELLRAVGLPEAFLQREARSLSGGEKQRVALARALANGPEVLILDEPTAALDPVAGELIVALIRQLSAGGLSVIMVTHVEAHAEALGGTRYRCEAGRILSHAL